MIMTARVILAAAIIVTSLPSASPAQQLAPLPVIAVVGDSLSVGLGEALQQAAPRIHIEGYGIVGSGLALSRIADWQARIRQVVSARPNEVIILIGMNDSSQAPGDSYVSKLRTFLTTLDRAGVPFLMVNIPPIRNSARNVNIQAVNALFETQAPLYGGRYLVLPGFPQGERTPDGIHFTAAGYRDLAAAVAQGVPGSGR